MDVVTAIQSVFFYIKHYVPFSHFTLIVSHKTAKPLLLFAYDAESDENVDVMSTVEKMYAQ